jgi:hypothetical protein
LGIRRYGHLHLRNNGGSAGVRHRPYGGGNVDNERHVSRVILRKNAGRAKERGEENREPFHLKILLNIVV